MINKAIVIGNMGKDIETRTLQGDKGKVGRFSVATSKKIKGEPRTTWHNIVMWDDKKIEYIEKYAGKGCLVYVEGEIENRQYEKDGETKYISEIVVGRFDGRVQILKGKDNVESSSNDSGSDQGSAGTPDIDDEIPW